MTVTLTPAEVESITGVADVTVAAITTADWLIDDETGFTPARHVTDRGLQADVVQMAWAIVAARVSIGAKSVGAEAVTAETQGDYQVTTDVGVSEKYAQDYLAGMPRQLLGEEIGFTVQVRAGQRVLSGVSSTGYWWL